MGGDIIARSTPGRGSVFTLTFLAEAAQNAAPVAETKRDTAPGHVARLRDAHVLLTDDNAINREVSNNSAGEDESDLISLPQKCEIGSFR